jgi:hypothetical protein
MNAIKEWILKTNIPVVLGYNTNETQIPCVSVTLANMAPEQTYLGDRGFDRTLQLQQYERDILIPSFQPKEITFSDDKTSAILTLPDSMGADTQNLFFPGLRLRDAKRQEYLISTDPVTTKPRIESLPDGAAVTSIDSSSLEVISPYQDVNYTGGAMFFRYNLNINIYSNSNQQDGIWLWMIVMWILLRNRPTMTKLFGIDLSIPSSGDYFKDPQMNPEHVWIRTITMTTQAHWTWLDAKQTDILGFLLYVKGAQSSQ